MDSGQHPCAMRGMAVVLVPDILSALTAGGWLDAGPAVVGLRRPGGGYPAETGLIVETPGKTQFENPFVLGVMGDRKIGPPAEQVVVEVLHHQQDTHSFPFGVKEYIQHRIFSHLFSCWL